MKKAYGETGVSPVQAAPGRQAEQVKGRVKGDGQECPSHTPPLKG